MKQQKNSHFTFTTIIHPPFVDQNKPEDSFYPLIGYNFASGDIKGLNQVLLIADWCYISKEEQIYAPYYSSYIQKSGGTDFLVTGGAYAEGDGIASTNFCFRMTMHDQMDGYRLKYESWRLGLLKEVGDEEIQEQVAMIPPMNFARHNHKVFELVKPGTKGEYLYLVVGGQFTSPEGWGVLNCCELYDEKSKVNENGEQSWEIVDPLVNARTGFSGFVLNNKVYVFGGYGFINDQMQLLNNNKVEQFDILTRKWKELKFKWSLGLNNNLGASCLPVSDKHVIIFGGANGEKATEKIGIMNIEKCTVENPKSKTKLSTPRAGAQMVLLKDVEVAGNDFHKVDSIQTRDLIVILGGNPAEVSFDYFTIKDTTTFDLEFLGKNEFNNAFTGAVTGTYQYGGMNDVRAWTQTMLVMPVLTLIQ